MLDSKFSQSPILCTVYCIEGSYPTVECVVELCAADVLLPEPGGATLLGEQLTAADRLVRPVVALPLAVARHRLLQAQAALASEFVFQ